MGEVIQFDRTKKKQVIVSESERLKALFTGNIEVYYCDTCGGEIEVINGNFPSHCPCCGIELEEWND